jgi:hypothetical protein
MSDGGVELVTKVVEGTDGLYVLGPTRTSIR